MNRELYIEFFQISVNTFYLWKKQKRPVIDFFLKYSNDKDIKEFLETKKIKSLEKNKQYKFISLHYLNIFRTNLEEFANPKIQIDDKHPLFIFFHFLNYIELDSKKNILSEEDYANFIEKIYTKFIIEEIYINFIKETENNKVLEEIENYKKLLIIDKVILSQISNHNISIEELIDNSKLKIYYLFYNIFVSFKENNLFKYMTKNNLTFKDITIDNSENIKNENKDFFIESFNEAYLNMNEFKKKYNDKNLEQEKLDIVNMIIKELELFKS